MIKIEYFRYMIEIFKTGSISRAAVELHVSQPYLSTALKELESHLGVQLFHRTPKGIRLTAEGESYITYAHEVNAILAKVDALGKRTLETQESLSIISFYAFRILDLYQAFSQLETWQQSKIQYQEMANADIPALVASGEANMGITYIDSLNKSAYDRAFERMDLSFTPLVSEPLHAVVSRLHPLANCNTLTLQNLAPYPLIIERYKHAAIGMLSKTNPYAKHFERFQLDPVQLDNNRSIMHYLLSSNRSFSLGQAAMNTTNPFVRSGELRYIPIIDLGIELITGIVHSDSMAPNTLHSSFMAYAIKAFSQ